MYLGGSGTVSPLLLSSFVRARNLSITGGGPMSSLHIVHDS
jgi:hypothetical protein